MKAINVPIPSVILRALEARYDVKKLQSALDADYNNDGAKDTDEHRLAINEVESGIKSAKATEGKTDGMKGSFKSVETHKVERTGVLNDPRRFTTWVLNFGKFIKTNGEPSGELTPEVLPANLVFWLERKFVLPEIAAKEKVENPKGNGVRNGGVGKVQTPEPAGATK